MGRNKSRCKECFYSKNKATQEPCNICSEIQHSSLKSEDHFLPESKNFLREAETNEA